VKSLGTRIVFWGVWVVLAALVVIALRMFYFNTASLNGELFVTMQSGDVKRGADVEVGVIRGAPAWEEQYRLLLDDYHKAYEGAKAIGNRAGVAEARGDTDEAVKLYGEAVAAFRQIAGTYPTRAKAIEDVEPYSGPIGDDLGRVSHPASQVPMVVAGLRSPDPHVGLALDANPLNRYPLPKDGPELCCPIPVVRLVALADALHMAEDVPRLPTPLATFATKPDNLTVFPSYRRASATTVPIR